MQELEVQNLTLLARNELLESKVTQLQAEIKLLKEDHVLKTDHEDDRVKKKKRIK